MAKPTVSPEWATQTDYTSDGDSWGGNPTKVDPGSSRRAEGIEPDIFPAQWMNHVLNAHGQWNKYIDDSFDSNDFHKYPAGPKSVALEISTFSFVGAVSAMAEQDFTINTASGLVWAPFKLPTSSILTGVDVVVDPGVARTGTNRMRVRIEYKQTAYPGGGQALIQIGSDAFDDTTGNAQTISLSGLSHTITPSSPGFASIDYRIEIKGGNDANTNPDKVLACRLYFDHVGLRNH